MLIVLKEKVTQESVQKGGGWGRYTSHDPLYLRSLGEGVKSSSVFGVPVEHREG